jgi:DNA-binding XRE family transcriptional regulator
MKEKKFSSLVRYRKLYGITQGKMAKIIEKSRSAYIRKENGESDFYRDEMVKICDYINARAKADGDKSVTMEQIFLQ